MLTPVSYTHLGENRIASGSNISNFEAAIFADFRAVLYQTGVLGLQRNRRGKTRRKIHHPAADRKAGRRREREVRRKVIAGMQLDGRSLATISRAGVIGGLITGWGGRLWSGRGGRGGCYVARAFN